MVAGRSNASPCKAIVGYLAQGSGQQSEGWQTEALFCFAGDCSDDIARLPSASIMSAANAKRPFFMLRLLGKLFAVKCM
jgi:hypothetical protein